MATDWERAEEERCDRINEEYDPDREAFWDEYGDAERLWRE